MQLKKFITTATILFFFNTAFGEEPIETLYNYDENELELDFPSKENVQKAEEEILKDFGFNPEEELGFLNEDEIETTLLRYSHLDPNKIIPRKLLQNAVVFFDRNKSAFKNKDYITIVDFSMRSNLQRAFIVNMNSGSVWALRTTHGAGGDLNHDGFVESLSNVTNSHKSSRGFYRVAEIYYGKYGRSIRLDGLSNTNSKARPRAIVIHGGDYIVEANKIPGRSWGCFVFAWSVKDKVVDRIHSGSLLYAEKSQDL